MQNIFEIYFVFQLGFTPGKEEQPLKGMKLQQKEAQKRKQHKRCLIILEVKPLRS